ncbi:hypothetical protein GGR57DRAFT_108988 [Xylariaceae sp. FL1272]|nr:hypothetical protein GGR57DRAFT_108988 [Xylariaceae sp. FL1272]
MSVGHQLASFFLPLSLLGCSDIGITHLGLSLPVGPSGGRQGSCRQLLASLFTTDLKCRLEKLWYNKRRVRLVSPPALI